MERSACWVGCRFGQVGQIGQVGQVSQVGLSLPPVVCIQTYGIGVIGLYGFFVSLLRGFGRLIILIRD